MRDTPHDPGPPARPTPRRRVRDPRRRHGPAVPLKHKNLNVAAGAENPIHALRPADLRVDRDGKPLVYAEELTHGSALYLPPDVEEPQSATDAICRAIDVIRDNVDLSISAHALGDRIRSYRDAHPGTGSLRIMAVNPGSGAVLRRAMESFVLPNESRGQDDPAPDDPQHLEIIAYSDRLSYTDPVADLRELQQSVASGENRRTVTALGLIAAGAGLWAGGGGPAQAAGRVPTPDHVVVVVMENHAYNQIIGTSSAPYINSLKRGGAILTASCALTHPSQPNLFRSKIRFGSLT